MYSSVLTPLFLGIIAGSVVSGRIDPRATHFSDAYVFSWLGIFPIAVGIFTVMICGFLAAVFIINETKTSEDESRFISKSKHMSVAALGAAVLVFVSARLENVDLATWLLGNPVSIVCMLLAIASLVWMWASLFRKKTKLLRIVAATQITLLLIAITYEHYPVIVHLKNHPGLSLLQNHGGEKTIRSLGIALLVGSIFILPALYYLLYSFSRTSVKKHANLKDKA